MKTFITTLIIVLAFLNATHAQNNFYNFSLYGGVSPKQLPVHAGLIINREDPMNEFIFNLKEVEQSYSLGIRKNFRFSNPFYGTLGLEYSRETQHYSMLFTHQEFPEGNEFELETSHQVISIPAGVGVKFNRLDVTSGLQMQYNIRSEMKEEIPMGIEMDKPGLEMGWYTGIGYSFDRTRIGVQYQSSLHRYGNNLSHNGKSMALTNVPGNIKFTIGYSF